MNDVFTIDQLTEWVAVEEKTSAPDGMGGFTHLWHRVSETWAHITPLMPNQSFDGWSATCHRVNSRYRLCLRNVTPMTSATRFLWNGILLETIAAPVQSPNRCFQTFIVQHSEPLSMEGLS